MTRGTATKRRLGRRAKIALGTGAVLAAVVLAAQGYMAYADAEHARFFQCGKSINAFLKEYGQSLREAFAARDPERVLRHYSAELCHVRPRRVGAVPRRGGKRDRCLPHASRRPAILHAQPIWAGRWRRISLACARWTTSSSRST